MIEIKNLTKQFKTFHREEGYFNAIKSIFNRKYFLVDAVKKVSLSIKEGEMVGFIGANGAGKTTTLKMLSGVIHPTSGYCKVMNFIPSKRDHEFLRQIAFIGTQKANLWWDVPAIDSFRINQVIYDIDQREFKTKVTELSEMLEVDNLLKKPIRQLSLGERMKMEIIGSLIHSPKIIFCDEPTIGLDFISRENLRQFFIEYHKKTKATLILTSHYLEDIENLCSRLVIIYEGVIVLDKQIEDIYKKHAGEKPVKLENMLREYYAQN
ncbi:ABC transporter ATP-binding protein [Fluviispira vulneris]|uniref:ABC transporter ATP-binding protein n=1 Tax=Fluviispira vulneris TaxID=2763012 RepID=UPI0016485F9F|nr:ATP-binding cassette domain-containing protein [Fluviispira vulneris]